MVKVLRKAKKRKKVSRCSKASMKRTKSMLKALSKRSKTKKTSDSLGCDQRDSSLHLAGISEIYVVITGSSIKVYSKRL